MRPAAIILALVQLLCACKTFKQVPFESEGNISRLLKQGEYWRITTTQNEEIEFTLNRVRSDTLWGVTPGSNSYEYTPLPFARIKHMERRTSAPFKTIGLIVGLGVVGFFLFLFPLTQPQS